MRLGSTKRFYGKRAELVAITDKHQRWRFCDGSGSFQIRLDTGRPVKSSPSRWTVAATTIDEKEILRLSKANGLTHEQTKKLMEELKSEIAF